MQMLLTIENIQKATLDIPSKLSLISEVREFGFDLVIKTKFKDDKDYVLTLRDKSDIELYEERRLLRKKLDFIKM